MAEVSSIAPLSPSDFAGGLATIADFLPGDQFARIAEATGRLPATERSYVPVHKKGGTIPYATLILHAPDVVAFYRSQTLRDRISATVGEAVAPTPLHDQSSCSILVYERPGDHIGWHFDHNFYAGRHFTVLIAVVNRNRDGTGLSSARLFVKRAGEEHVVPTPPNALIVFEGVRVLHRATPVGAGERRVVLSMTFCTDPRNSLAQEIARRVKDTAYFGIRALWT